MVQGQLLPSPVTKKQKPEVGRGPAHSLADLKNIQWVTVPASPQPHLPWPLLGLYSHSLLLQRIFAKKELMLGPAAAGGNRAGWLEGGVVSRASKAEEGQPHPSR